MVIGSRSLERLKLAKEADKSSRGLILPSSPKPPPPPSRAASGSARLRKKSSHWQSSSALLDWILSVSDSVLAPRWIRRRRRFPIWIWRAACRVKFETVTQTTETFIIRALAATSCWSANPAGWESRGSMRSARHSKNKLHAASDLDND